MVEGDPASAPNQSNGEGDGDQGKRFTAFSQKDRTKISPARYGPLSPMMTWTSEELDNIGKAEELQITSLRRDDIRRKPVTIWVVRVGDELCVRSVNGRTAPWFHGVQARHEGHISAGGVGKEVIFTDADPKLNDEIDTAYRAKYHRYQANIVDSVVSPKARSATIRLLAR